MILKQNFKLSALCFNFLLHIFTAAKQIHEFENLLKRLSSAKSWAKCTPLNFRVNKQPKTAKQKLKFSFLRKKVGQISFYLSYEGTQEHFKEAADQLKKASQISIFFLFNQKLRVHTLGLSKCLNVLLIGDLLHIIIFEDLSYDRLGLSVHIELHTIIIIFIGLACLDI